MSPIPALLAASMTKIREQAEDATPLPAHVAVDATTRFDATDEQALMMEDDSEYVVEFVGAAPKSAK